MKQYQAPFQMSSYEKSRFNEMVDKCNGDKRLAFDYWTKWKIKTDLFYFGNEVMGWRYACNKARTRWRIDPELHKWYAGLLMKPGDKLIQMQRYALKTTWVKLRIVQIILNDPMASVLLGSVTTKLVRRELAYIKRLLAHPIILRLFKSQVPKPGNNYINWEKSTQDELTVKRDEAMLKPGEEIPQESQITVVGADTRITGFHFGYAFFDDPVDADTVRTSEQMQKSEEWWEFMQPILDTDAEITWTCTPYHERDLSAKIIKEKQIENVYRRSNIENGKIVYKSWFTFKDFEKLKKRMGPYSYACQIECNPTPIEERIFPPPQPTFSMPLADDVKGYRYYLLIDPAATTKAYSDSTAFVIIAVNHLNQVFVVESFSFKREGDEIADLIIKKHLQYGFTRVGVELGLQSHLKVIIKMKIAEWERDNGRHLGLSVAESATDRALIMAIPIGKESKVDRVGRTLGSLVRTDKIRINAICRRLLGQMDMFTGKAGDEDDEVDALSMCVYVVETFAQHYQLPKVLRNPGLTWRDFHNKRLRKTWDSRFRHAS